ncbi:MAG TPA: PIN domain-containing protein [Stellaceae bacterium]|nr:PIN domain-containing protein [Stellaceae bacterium]
MRASGALLDTGPLVAYLYARDRHHDWAVEQFETFKPPFISCEAVLTEACFLVVRNGQRPTLVLDLIGIGVVRLDFDVQDELAAVRTLIERYANVPMSLADACLVRLAEMTGLPICTLDDDFAIYRTRSGRALRLIMPERRRTLHEP